MSRRKRSSRTTEKLPSIVLEGDPILRTSAFPVLNYNAELKNLAKKMQKKMKASKGIGLAANQVGSRDHLFVYDVDGERGAIANAVVVFASAESHYIMEGCLSMPHEGHKRTEGPLRVAVRGRDLNGKPVHVYAEGLLARCFIHEIDHLHGELFTDHL